MSDEIWRLPRVLSVTGMGRSWIYAASKCGDFPEPVRLGARAIGWKRSDIESWIDSRTREGGSI